MNLDLIKGPTIWNERVIILQRDEKTVIELPVFSIRGNVTCFTMMQREFLFSLRT
jgi:hypothetical protein